jgi:hypothetical protein
MLDAKFKIVSQRAPSSQLLAAYLCVNRNWTVAGIVAGQLSSPHHVSLSALNIVRRCR